MKQSLIRMLSCMLLVAAAAVSVNAANGIIEEKNYSICPGDTIIMDKRQTVVYSDTILYDTIRVTDPSKDSIYVYVVNVYPTFLRWDTQRTIERGTSFTWHGIEITKAGQYEKVYKSMHECDSIYRITVRERVTTHITDTLCLGSMKTFGSQTLTEAGIYYDTLHYASYDSVIVLSLLGHKPDTILTDIRIPEGTSFDWQGENYDTQGVYDKVFTDRFGCDSLQRLVLTVYHVDTIDTAVVVCPGESFTWHGHTGGETRLYEYSGLRDNGDQVWYRLDLTVKTMATVDTTLIICDDETISFNGKVYANAGEYYDQYTCDTLFKITVIKHPTKLHVQTGVLDRTHPYYWRYYIDGEQKVDTILAPGIYEYTTHDPETGCNEIYRLILTKDETTYHFITDTVICENEYFEWRGKQGLNRQGIGTTTHYFDRYRTAADQDSIYELILRVQPVPRVSQTIKFCDNIVWGGVTYTESTILVDTFQSIQYHCDSIVTTQLIKGIPFHKHDTASIRPGETLEWRGQIITHDGLFKDEYVTAAGCDSVYSIGVVLEEVPVATPTRTWRVSICEGDFYEWEVTHGRYFNGGTYVDTVFNANDPRTVDSLNILIVTQNPKYVTRERITSHSFPTYYRGQEFYRDQEVEFHYTSVDGCDSVIIVVAEFEISHFEENVVICPGEVYVWDWDGLTYRETGRYYKTIKDQNGNDSVEHILNLTVRYIPETYIKKTICKGSSFTYGDRTLSEAGVYDFTFHETGCDSIVHLALNVVNPDTIRYVHHMNEHDSYTWHGETYHETGVYYYHGTNRWGCDSLEILQLTVNHVDTIDTTAVICPNEIPFVWHGITASQTGKFTGTEEINGTINYYRLNLTVREMVYLDTTFTVCGDQSVTFHGATYSEAGIYPNYIACDTIINVRIVNHPQQVYETHARMTDEHGYHWTYWENGVQHENVLFNQPGTYEFESPNAETGCSEIWRLILTLDENSYFFQEAQTICEGDDFTWHGLTNLSGVTGTNTYRVEYETHAGKDSIYELTLTVVPIERTVRTITFCGETTWKGKTYTNSAVVYDTISLASGCYRIERINLDKAQSYYFTESKQWPQGKVLIWHGQNITTDGVYYDRLTTVQGCDSVYELTVTIIPAAPENNQYAEELSTCEGDTILWRGKYIWRSGTYVDTVWAEGKIKVDSIFTLSFTAWPAPKDTIYEHLYTCNDGGIIRYNGKDYRENDTIVTTYHTIHGCDSIVKTYLHFNEALFLRDTARVAENTLPYAWTPTGTDTTIYLMEPSTYQYKQKTNGGCENVWELFFEVYPVFILRDSVTICESELPYHWERGPIEYRNTDLSAEPGTTREISYSYISTVTGTDSVYILKMTVLPQIKKVEQHYFCAGENVNIYGKTYYLSGSDSVVRDTIMRPNPEAAGCDSIIYLEIYQNPVNRSTETVIMHVNDTITWHNLTITDLINNTYEVKEPNSTGCEEIYQLRVIAEKNHKETICILDTPYVWREKTYSTPGWYTDTVINNGVIEEFYTLTLLMDTVPTRYEQVFFCEGDQIKIGDKIYHNLKSDSVYRDTLRVANSENLCDSVIYYEITQYPVKHTIETKILHVDSIIVWNGMTITELVDRTYTYSGNIDPQTGCTITEQLRVIAEHRENKTVCVLDTPYTGWRGYAFNTTGLYTDTVFENGFIKEFHSLDFKVDTVPTRIEQHFVCFGYPEKIRGKWFGRPTDPADTVYHFNDTILSPTSQCDSVILVEVHISSVKEHHQTIVLHDGESYTWNDKEITTGGIYRDTTVIAEGCDSISILQVIKELRIDKTICRTDTAEDTPADKKYPYVWVHQRPDVPNDTLYTSGIYTDTTFDADGYITEYYSLHLNIVHPYDTTIYVHGCKKMDVNGEEHSQGAWWYGQPNEIFWNDTSFIFRKEVNPYDPEAPCDSIFYVNVVMDTAYIINVVDTICEHELPYILGRHNPDTIWGPSLSNPGNNKYKHEDFTVNGCDSTIYLTLTIIPSLKKNDSTFVCEEFFEEGGFIWLGDTVSPWFDTREGGKYHGAWEGKWHGVPFSNDTIVWNCDSTFSHHIIMRPKQDVPAKDTFYLCQGDSVQLFWPHSTEWVYTEGVYYDTIRTYSAFTDEAHGTSHFDKNFLCDSIIEWTVFMLDTIHEYDTIHIPMGDSLMFDNKWRYVTGVYDSISYEGIPGRGTTAIQGANGLDLPTQDSRGQYCKYVKTLYLFVDSTYYLRDTLSICEFPSKDTLYTWEDGYQRVYSLPDKDTAYHVIDTLPTLLYRFDSIYDLYIDYRQRYFTQIMDTICEGDSLRFDIHNRDNTITQRFVSVDGVYYDTIPALNGCDSIIQLYLKTRDSIPTTYINHTITDREIPYLWGHHWLENGLPMDSTDTLRATGIYRFTMPSQYGCDSTIVLNFTVHQTHVFRDTIDVCSVPNKTFTHIWSTGREMKFTVPDRDSAIHYYDTLQTRIKYDSIYDLLVNYKEQTITYLDSNICYGDSIQFGLTRAHQPRFLYKSGVYNDTLVRTVNGCDSIIVLRLNVFPRYFNDTTIHISSADTPFVWIHNQGGVEIARDSLYAPGDYKYTFNSIGYGCDSIDSLHLIVHQAYFFRDTIQICESETPYTWGSKTDIYTTGEYYQYFRTRDGYADSTYARYIKVMPIEHDTIQMSICEGDSLRFGLTNDHEPRWLFHKGLYNDTLTTIHGCDSIITLSLNVFPRHINDTTIHIADKDTPYVWIHYQHGHEIARDSLYAEGRYGYSFHSQYGCDSIDSLTIVVHPTYLFRDTITICTSETPYTWYNVDSNGDSTLFQKAIYDTGLYIKNLQTHDGYDSTYMRYVYVRPVMRTEIHDSICAGENNFYTFKGQRLTESGIYVDTLTASNGCDSIVTLNLTVNKPYYSFREEHIVEGQSIHINGHIFTTDTVYTQKGNTPNGCDSTTVIKVVVHPLVDTTVIVCSYDLPYQWINKWNGQVTPLYADGLYRNDTTFVDGKQMFYGLRLIVNEPVYTIIHDSICFGENNFYTFKEQHLTESGIYRDTTTAANGCDSIIELHLTVNKPYYNFIERHIIEGQSVTVLGHTFDKDTLFTLKGQTPNGCDSIIDIKVIMHPLVDTTVVVCSYDLPYLWTNKWNGQVTPLYADGLYRNDTTFVDGKQMFYGLRLIVNEPVYTIIHDSICIGENNFYTFKEQHLTESGIYRDTTTAANGCDSIIELHLTVNKPYYNFIERHIIEGQSVTVLGHTFDSDTLFTLKGQTPNGCDSITDIKVIMHPLVDTTVVVCSYDLPYLWTNKWNGQVTPLYADGLYRNDTTYVDGKQMFYGLRLIVNEPVFDTIRHSMCEGSSYEFKGNTYYEQGIYRDTLSAANGCDSIVTLILTVNQPYYNVIRETILEGNSYNFYGTEYTTSGNYTHYARTPEGCDSTTVLQLSVHPIVDTIITVCDVDLPVIWYNRWNGSEEKFFASGIFRNDTTINGEKRFYGIQVNVNNQVFDTIRHSMCEGSSYEFKGNTYYEQGIYRDTLSAANGCDSIVTLILTVNQPYYNVIRETILEGNSYNFYGTEYTTSGNYTHYARTPEGCDSTTVLQLSVHPIVDTIITVCDVDLPVIWHNRWNGSEEKFFASGIFRNDTTINGEKRFYGIQVNVNNQVFDTIRHSMCEGSSYEFKGNTYYEQGIYRDTLSAANGCDSIVTLILTVNKPYYNVIRETILEGNSYNFYGTEYTTSGNYTHYARTPEGCDSTTVLQLSVHPIVDTIITVCDVDLPVIWYNRWNGSEEKFFASGIFRNDTTINGEKRFYGIQVNVNYQVFDTIRHSMCEGSSYEFKGNTYTQAGIYRDTLSAANGCDSIVTLILTVNKPYYNVIRETILEGNSYNFYGTEYTTSGNYTHYARTPEGCDSTTVLQLSVHPIVDTIITVCDVDLPVIWYNRWNGSEEKFFASGIFRNDTTINGEKRFYGIQVNVNYQVFDTIRHSMCEGSSYEFKGNTYYEQGIYRDTLNAANGCDSIVTLILTVNQPYYNIIRETILEGNSYNFYGTEYTTSGNYTHYARTPEGCDSTTVLQLSVHPIVDTIITVCDVDLPVIWYNRWNGSEEKFFASGIFRNDTTINGEKRFYGIQVNVNYQVFDTIRHSMCEGSSYEFKGNTYYEQGIYRDTLSAANGCDSIVTLILTVNQPYYNVIRETILEGNSYNFYGTEYTTSGNYTHYARTPEGCDSTTVLQLSVHPIVDTIITVCDVDLPVIWYNRWNGSEEKFFASGIFRNDTTINGEKRFYGIQVNVNYQVFDTIRHAMCEGSSYEFKGNTYTQAGIYRDTLSAANGCDSIVTLILTVNQPYYNVIRETILEGNSYNFYGTEYTTSGNYTHYARTPEGCDSTTVLQLSVHPIVDTIITVCDVDLPVIWYNRWNGSEEKFFASGIFRNDTTINGEKRFYGIQVNVNYQVFDTIRHAMCEGSSYEFKGNTYYEQGIYRDTLSAANGCDSIVTLILTVNQPYYNVIRETILEGNSYNFYGTEYTTSGNYTHYARTPEGCDSTTVLQLSVHPIVDTIITVCDVDLPVIWYNRWNGSEEKFFASGIFRNDTTINGEKRFYGIQVNVNNQVFDTVRAEMCHGSSYLFAGQALTEAGIYRDTLRAENGCDSIVTLVLTVNDPYYNVRTEHIIEGNEFVFYGDTFNTTGVYTHYGKTEFGCDSTSVLQLYVHPLVDTVVTICSSELPYQWVNKWNGSVSLLTSEGIYRNDTTYFNGERMFCGLQLIVTQPTEAVIYREICEDDAYNFNGQLIKTAGEYRDTIKNTVGCDSIIILHLNVLKKYYNTIVRTIHEGDTVMFNNQVYSEAGIYTTRYTSSYGCDSIVELRLNIIRLFDDSITVCANELPYVWKLPSDSTKFMTIYESGIYRDTVTNTEGMKTAIGLKVNVLPIAHAPEAIVATICEGDFYKFGDEVLTTQGTYYDTLVAANGCDSIVMLALQVLPVQYQSDVRRIFEGDTVYFYGDTLTTSGIYEHRVTNENGCTDTYQLILTVLKSFNVDTTARVCKSDLPFIWHGYEYNASGDYSLPVAWTDSSRVVKTLHLTVDTTYSAIRNIDMCHGNVFIYKRDTFKTDTIFYDTIPSIVGCDSILKYVIRVQPTFERWDTVHISDKDSYTFNGRDLTITGDYESTALTVNGCDSITHLHLVVHPSYFNTEFRSICAPDTIHWRGQAITMDSMYILNNTTTRYGKDTVYTFLDKYLTRYGFDSIFELQLTVHPSYFIYEQYLIKEGETTTLHGINITKTDSLYTDTLHTLYGCDSVYHIAVNTKRMMEVDRTVRICDGEYYDLFGQKLTKAGTYTGMNADTIVHLTLIVNPTSLFKQRIVITDEEIPYIYKGHFYEPEAPEWDPVTKTWDKDVKTTIFADSLLNQYGCDSIVRIEFVVTTHYSPWNQVPLCTGSILVIDKDTITKAGQYSFVRRSTLTNKLDSLFRVEVYESPAYEMPVVKASICQGDSILFNRKYYRHTGVYRIVEKTTDGCDSVLTLDLTVNPAARIEMSASIWYEDVPYTWEGRDYYNTGTYERSWHIDGEECDSTRVLHLIVLQPDTQKVTVCDGQPFTWYGTTYTESGVYSHTTYTQDGKIAAMDILILNITTPTVLQSAYIEDISESADELIIHFDYSGYAPAAYNILFDAKAKQAGFTDIYGAPVLTDKIATIAIPKPNGTCWNGSKEQYIRPDYYTLKFVLDNGSCGVSRSDDLEFLIKYPSWIIEQNWDDVVAPLNSQCNCGYDFADTRWFLNGQIVPSKATGYLHYDGLRPGDKVHIEAKRKGDGYFVPSYPLTIVKYDWQSYDEPVLDPNAAPRRAPVVAIESNVEGTYEVYSSTGTLIGSGTFTEGNTPITLPAVSGIYFIRTVHGNKAATHKAIVY